MKQVCTDGKYCFVKFGPPNALTVSNMPEIQAMCIPKESCNYWVEDALSISTWTQVSKAFKKIKTDYIMMSYYTNMRIGW